VSDREKFAAHREALAASSVHTSSRAHRYESAFRRYLAAIAYQEHRLAHADEHAGSAGRRVDMGWADPGVDPSPGRDLQDARVRDVMTRDVVAVDADATFRELVDTLTTHRISAVPVVDSDSMVIGIVSESDLLAKVVTGGDPHARLKGGWSARSATRRKSQAASASGLMTSPAVTTGPRVSVVDAARTAAAEMVRRMPVVDDAGRLVGIVTPTDLLSVFDRSDEDIRGHVIDDILRAQFCINPLSVGVKVDQGVVSLYGELESAALVRTVGDAVRSTRGVVGVTNKLSYRISENRPPELIEPMY
jgi:CBS domain-containing protein